MQSLVQATVLSACIGLHASEVDRVIEADVIVVGGSTAALAAAFAAADEGVTTVLLEPTDWIGGQLTSSGVPAVDEAWHRIEDNAGSSLLVSKIARDPRNMTPWFRDVLEDIGNPGRGWVSRFCFEPRAILEHFEARAHQLADKLTIYHQTVVKRLAVDGRNVVSLTAIQRFPKGELPAKGYDQLPSDDIVDWYTFAPSDRFDKRVLEFRTPRGKPGIFIDATEWGEVLALSGKRYLQGVDKREGALECDDTCGQATVFGLVQEICEDSVVDPATSTAAPALGFGQYHNRADAWERIWTYRRIKGNGQHPTIGDLSLQNWGYSIDANHGGNDYPFGYLFAPKSKTYAQLEDWVGGVDLAVMAAAEQRAFAWHQWLKQHASEPFTGAQIRLRPDVLGTAHGLSKLPYIRDTRRAVGIDGFVLTLPDLIGEPGDQTGTRFPDRIAIGCYPADVHHLATCEYPSHTASHFDTRPFYIPYRALTHESFDNLLVAGKTMAQSFMANSATRLHPIEWSTGTAAGICAALASRWSCSTVALSARIQEVQQVVARHTPIDWEID